MRLGVPRLSDGLVALSVIAVALLLSAVDAGSADLRVMSGGAVKPALSDLAKVFEQRTGHRVDLSFATVGALQKQIAAGERADVYVMTDAAVDELVKKDLVVAGSKVDVARVGVGIAVREGAPRPDISSLEAFKATLLSAGSIAYIDPDKGGTSGIHVRAVLERLGIADQVKAKTILVPSGYVAELVARDQAEIGIHQISEIMAVKGAVLLGPLPREVQKVTVYAAGIGKGPVANEAAAGFVRFLRTPEAREKFARAGLGYAE